MAIQSPGSVAALIVAGGRGIRAGGGMPKQYRPIGGHSILARSLRPFLDHPAVSKVAVVIHPDDRALYDGAAGAHPKLTAPVEGGAERQESVRLGLEALAVAGAPDVVLIHDAVRPFASAGLIDRVIQGLAENEAILPALPVADTLKRADGAGHVVETVSRSGIYAAQTPQGFHFASILTAHRSAQHDAHTDDAGIAEAAGITVRLVEGEAANQKITSQEDIAIAERLLAAGQETKVATGYDVHATGPGDHVVLGGVRIPHDRSLVGHSDADVVLHAITDAILGTIGDGDIGSHFPPSDASLKGVSSDRFLAKAVALLKERGGTLSHVDATIIAEAPKIGPHRDAMRAKIAEICGVPLGSVAVKATTNERLGFVGRRRRDRRPCDGHGAFANNGRMTDLTPLHADATNLIKRCDAAGLTVATAESCTGGLVAGTITDIAGASRVFGWGVVTYSNEAKVQLLGVPEDLLAEHGAVSDPVAQAMAEGALTRSGADVAVAVTGIAGPDGGTAEKPVGLVFFAAARKDRPTVAARHMFMDLGREATRFAATQQAIRMLMQQVVA